MEGLVVRRHKHCMVIRTQVVAKFRSSEFPMIFEFHGFSQTRRFRVRSFPTNYSSQSSQRDLAFSASSRGESAVFPNEFAFQGFQDARVGQTFAFKSSGVSQSNAHTAHFGSCIGDPAGDRKLSLPPEAIGQLEISRFQSDLVFQDSELPDETFISEFLTRFAYQYFLT